MQTIGILVGGGPAPGINGVIGSAATVALGSGAQVLGCLSGFKWLMAGDTDHVRELHLDDIEKIHLQGGSILEHPRPRDQGRSELHEVASFAEHTHRFV